MKRSLCLMAIFLLNFSGLSENLNICPTCPNTVPDYDQIKQIVESVGKPLIDSFVREVKIQVDESKLKQESAARIIDSVYNEKFKRIVVGEVHKWPLPSGKVYYEYWMFCVYPNGDSLYCGAYNKIK